MDTFNYFWCLFTNFQNGLVIKFLCISLLFAGLATNLNAQSTFVPLGSEEQLLFDRMEALSGQMDLNSGGNYLPLERKAFAEYLTKLKTERLKGAPISLSPTDQNLIDRAIGLNGEWVEDATGMDGAIPTKKPILKYFYTTKGNLYHVNTDNFFLTVNPILYTQLSANFGETDERGYTNLRGAELRGRIANRIGFYTMLGDQQQQPLPVVYGWEQQYHSYPGNDYYILKDKTFDAFLGRGYITFDAFKNNLQVAFGYDKQFVGNGVRSLVQSNETAASTFLRVKFEIGKFTFDNLYQELVGDFPGLGNDERLPKKYSAYNQISTMLLPNLNIGIFESTVFDNSCLHLTNVIPVVFSQTIARSLGAQQKTSLGLNFKYLPIRGVQVYGQGLIDQLDFSAIGKGSYKNSWAGQLGVKYYNAFSVSNLDLQLEGNYVRPFMYQSNDGRTNGTHYNQPLAHPMGAGFAEGIFKIKYQPTAKWFIDVLASYYIGNADTSANFGTNLSVPKDQRIKDDGYGFLPENKRKSFYVNGNIAYELFTNFFLEIGVTAGKSNIPIFTTNGTQVNAYGGLRWNIARKQNFIYN